MNYNQTSTPRAIIATAAVALTAVTLGLAVVVPATMGAAGADVRTLAAAKAVAPAPTEVAIIPARIEVIGVREPALAATQDKEIRGKRDRQG